MHIDTMECLIHGLGHEGQGVGRDEGGRVVFVRGALPGQTVEAAITKSKKNFAEADLLRVIHEAPGALPAPCVHHRECGGCPLQAMPGEKQLYWKENFVREALRRIGHAPDDVVEPITPSPRAWDYRNKIEFALERGPDGRISIGLRRGRSHETFDASACLLMDCAGLLAFARGRLNAAGPALPPLERESRPAFVVRRGQDEAGREAFLAAMITPPGTPAQRGAVAGIGRDLLAALPEAAGFAHVERGPRGEETVCALGAPSLSINVRGLSFSVGHGGFFQVNSAGAEILCRKVAECAAIQGGETIWDLYCGGGLLGLALLQDLRERGIAGDIINKTKIYGIESDAAAVKNAIADSRKAGFKTCRFIAGEAHSLAPSLPAPDVVVADPPRGGLHPAAVKTILKRRPERIVLASCNPATLARDVAALMPGYLPLRVFPVDLFPHTAHVESVAALGRRSGAL